MDAELQRWRDAQRQALTVARSAVPVALRRQWDAAITQRLLQQFPTLHTRVVGGYWPFRGEFDPRFLLRQLRLGGGRTALPVVVGKQLPLEFRAWWPGAPMRRAVLGLPVPDGTERLVPQAVLIPPLGFDGQGYRLGYGGGFFDRTLAAMPQPPLKIGVAFELSRIATIRPQPHDIAMDFIATEAALYRVADTGLETVDPGWRWG